jgi:acetoin utilization protein AcuB
MAHLETVAKHMHAAPYCVSQDEKLITAHALMREHGIRHLPVMDAGRLIGIVTERDLFALERFAGVDPSTFRVAKAMHLDPFTVRPDVPIDEVAEAMLERKVGSAVVVDRDHVIGVFTTTDALRALAVAVRALRGVAPKRSRRRRRGGAERKGDSHEMPRRDEGGRVSLPLR